MAQELQPPPSNPDTPAPRRDAVTWVLTGVTTAVLLVGVLVIRSTRPQAPPRSTESNASLTAATTPREAEPAARQRVIVALPEVASTVESMPPETAGLPNQNPSERR